MRQFLTLITFLVALLLAGACEKQEQPKTPQSEIDAMARSFVENLTSANFSAVVSLFDSTMAAQLTEENVGQIWSSLTDQFGTYIGPSDTRSDTLGGYNIVYVTMEFERGPIDAKVVISNDLKVAGLFFVPAPPKEYRPPDYIGDLAFAETDVKFGDTQWLLPGILTMPDGDGPFPALILVHGSGPKDRDETVGSVRPFKDLAWGLASRGIAVLRYDKRTLVHGDRFAALEEYTVQDEVIKDVLAARDLLDFSDKIDKNRIFVLGHSFGGMLLPRISEQSPNLAGLIVLAGNTRPLGDHLLEQTKYLFELDGSFSADEQQVLERLGDAADLATSDSLTAETPASDLPMGVVGSYWLDLRGYRPHEEARNLSLPMLIMQGERDYEVTMADFKNWQTALGSKTNVTLKSYPALNHLFLAGVGMSVPDEYFRPAHLAEEVVVDIAEWIMSR
jgi:dienelactone hydrolase